MSSFRNNTFAAVVLPFAKIGAVATAFLFPILLVSLGTRLLLYGLIAASLLGAVVTWIYRIETTGVNLDRIGETTSEPEASRQAVA
jgi:MFS transporter, putative metabolite transport protein